MPAERTNAMGTEKMSRLILTAGIPLMLSLLINSLYNFVDSVFVSRISEDALTALSLAAPVQTLVSALGLGNAVGLNAVISRALGANLPDKVRKAADGAIFIALCSWILISALCLLFVGPYFSWQSGGSQVIAAYGRDYLSICMLFSFGQMGQWVFDRFVIASGRSHLFLFTLSAASLTNLLLDPIFIFGLFGLPRLETRGAAMNTILLSFSTTAVAVYGICARVQGLATVGVHGIDNGLIPIVAYNYGAEKKERIGEAVRWAILYSALFYLVFFAALTFAPGPVLEIFQASDHMLAIGKPALRIFAAAYFVSIPNLVCSAALQGLSRGTASMCLTMTRQALLPVLLAFVLQFFGNLNLIWSAFVLSELAGIPLAALLWSRAYRSTLE